MAAAIRAANALPVLPDEVLVCVLRHVRHAEREEDQEQHISCLYVCKTWLHCGRELFYKDIVVGDHNVDSFTAAVADWPGNFAVTRNLTVVLSLGWQEELEQHPEAECGGYCGECPFPSFGGDVDDLGDDQDATRHGLNHHGRLIMDHMPMKQLGERILRLSGAIGKLSGLITFSFTIDADTRDMSWCGCYVPVFARGPLTHLVLALPSSCVNLELDTDGTERTGSEYLPWNHDIETDEDDREQMGIETFDKLACANNGSNNNEVPTLCKAIYQVLPQLENVRLRCGMLCPNIIGLTHALRVQAPPATLSRDFPNLKTFVLNQVARNMHPVAIELCGYYMMGTRAWDTYSPRSSYELAGALSHCRRFFPNLKKCQIISSQPLRKPSPTNTAAETALQPWRERLRDGPCEHEQIYHIRSYDVLEDQTVVMPFEPIKQNLSVQWYSLYPALWEWNLFRNQDHEVSIGSLRQMESAVEDAWCSTTTGLRFTKDFNESNADDGMMWVAVGGGTQAQYESFHWNRRYWNRLPEAPDRWEDVGDSNGFGQSLSRGARIEYFEDDAEAEGAGLSVYQEALKREVESFDGYVG